jgi:hypothetical protein
MDRLRTGSRTATVLCTPTEEHIGVLATRRNNQWSSSQSSCSACLCSVRPRVRGARARAQTQTRPQRPAPALRPCSLFNRAQVTRPPLRFFHLLSV